MSNLNDHILTFRSAVNLERFVSRKTLTVLRTLFFIGTAFSGFATLVLLFFFENNQYDLVVFGIFLLFSGLWLEQILLYAYHNSFFFHGLNSVIGLDTEPVEGVTYEIAKSVLKHPDDLTLAFCSSPFGSTILLRAGVPFGAVDDFLASARRKLPASDITIEEGKVFSFIDLGKYLLSHDTDFATLFSTNGVQVETFIGSLNWVVLTYHEEKRLRRWWGKDNLSRTQGIGREWTYGISYSLNQYARDIRTSAVFSTLTKNSAYASGKVSEIETALAKAKASNVLILGEPGVGKIDLVMEVKRRIETGASLGAVAGKQIVVLDTNRLFAINKDKASLEVALLKLLGEAYDSGNIIIVIENLSTVIREAEAMGVFLPELIDEFTASPLLQFIATDSPGAFHTFLEPLSGLIRRFTEVLVETPDLFATVRLLQGVALQNELRYKILFTYGALETIAKAADRYIVEGVMPDKAVTLLVDVASMAGQTNTDIVTQDFVYECVSKKTGIPAGPIGDTERDLLLHLEDKLHTQVVGQKRAIDAIARTMRRARAGIQSSEKPIGSFLFLGPTGVGKTETAKALAKLFFGSESKMHRFDMSEYSGDGALERLLGTSDVSGVLSNMLREHPYSVVLLDELEKGAREVHDLFLQILDEGIFTDGRGEKINARNTIIIATSNAGSRLIMNTVEQRKVLGQFTEEIISHIIREGIFRPELINRFDSTIIFEPLTETEQTHIARLMLGGLYARVKEQGYLLEVSDDLLAVLIEKGYSPEFGARPMQRVLQDIVEEKVAAKIISGEAQKGDTIHLTREDVTDAELAI